MSPELALALACYREWLHAVAWADWCDTQAGTAASKLKQEEFAEYERLTAAIKAEIED